MVVKSSSTLAEKPKREMFSYILVATEAKEIKPVETEATAKPKAKPKVEEKPLPQMMEEDIIPAIKLILEEAQKDITDIELSFQDNKVFIFISRSF